MNETDTEHSVSADVMDPSKSPAAPGVGVRRVNGVPDAILWVAGLAFMGLIAYAAAGRAANQSAEEGPQVETARDVATKMTQGYEAGQVDAAEGGTQGATGGRGADASKAGEEKLPKGFKKIPPPPGTNANTNTNADPGSLTPPSSAGHNDDGAQAATKPKAGAGRGDGSGGRDGNGGGGGGGPRRQRRLGEAEGPVDPMAQMRHAMFVDALTSKTTVGTMPSAHPGQSQPEGREGRQGRAPETGYMGKLKALQQAGLLPASPKGTPNAGEGEPAPTGAYGRFEGKQGEDRWAAPSRLEAPNSPFELRAGAVIPGTMLSGINSDLPGQITALVAQDVRDTATGRHVLIPQASRLVGTYGSDVKFGQQRVLVAWQRIVFPDGKALDIGAMPGADGAGYAGFSDQVNNHYVRLFASAVLMSGITAGISVSQGSVSDGSGRTTMSGAMTQSLGQQLGQLSEEMIRRQMNVAPTIEIRPGYRFNIQVTKDLTFSAPYQAHDYERSVSLSSRPQAASPR